jgi:two-component system phosphate regulon sensor histidine kinase PhoR
MNRIFKKIALRISLLFLIVVIAVSLLTVIYLDRAYKNEVKDTLFKNAEVIESILLLPEKYDKALSSIDAIEDMRITLIDYDGSVIFDSRVKASELENHSDRPEVVQAMADGKGSDIRRSDTLGSDMMYFAYRSDKLNLIIRTAMLLQGISAYSSSLWVPMLIMLLSAFLICLIIALFVSRSVTRPISQLKKDTVMIAEGRYDELKKLRTGDELESLSGALCDMAVRLRQNFEAITENNSRLEAVLRAVPGGIIAVDGEFKVIMANPAARGMFTMDERPEGRHFLVVTQHAGLESVIREAARSTGVVERELAFSRGMDTLYLQVFAASVFAEGKQYGVILLVQDITHLHKLENLRRDFVANVTHELKTPLTVIRGFVETLKDPDLPRSDIGRFLDIIALESERLTRLINDVLLLSEIENIAERPKTSVDIRNGISEAFQLLDNAARDKNQTFSISLPESPVMVAAVGDRIKQLAINLIDNAVKYTPAGGCVNVSLTIAENKAVLRVSDTGIGIPEANIPRLFERFYRVDTSRSRSLGGTGLGLAIVKHIVSLLDGHITVESRVGEGSAFTVYLSLYDGD